MSHAAVLCLLLIPGLLAGTADSADQRSEPPAAVVATKTPSDASTSAAALDRAGQDRRVAEVHDLLDGWDGDQEVLERVDQQLQSVLQANPQHVQAHVEMARYYLDMGNEGNQVNREALGHAGRELDQAEKIEPDNANVQVLLGKVREDLHHYPDAIAALDRAKALGTHNPWLYLNYASTDAAMGRWEQSALSLRMLESEKPRLDPFTGSMQDASDNAWLAIHKHDQDTTAMAADYQRMIARSPCSYCAHAGYAGFLLAWRSDVDGAIDEANKADGLMQGAGDDTLALAEYVKWDQLRDRDPAQAKRYLESARARMPDRDKVVRNALSGLGKSPLLQHLVATFIAEGSSLETVDDEGYTALLCAIACGDPESVEWLLDHGAGVDTRQAYDQSTPLIWAALKSDLPSLLLLARHGADVNASNQIGRTALWFAVYNDNEPIVKALLGLKAKVDQTGEDRNTPLIEAATTGLTPVARLLLDAGADPSISTGTLVAADYADLHGHSATATLIRSRMRK